MAVGFKWPWDLKKIGFSSIKWIGELPKEYARLKSLSMNNDCYFTITNFKLNGSDTLKFTFSVTAACNVLGCYTDTNAQTNYSLYVSTNGNYLRYNGGTANSTVTFNTKYNMIITPTGATGISTVSWTEKSFTSPVDLCIGTTSVSATSAKLKGTLYGDIEVVGRLKLIPVERLSDNKIGYYDTYSSIFYLPTIGTPTSGGYA